MDMAYMAFLLVLDFRFCHPLIVRQHIDVDIDDGFRIGSTYDHHRDY
jgi:hypothetical protein